MSYFTTWAFTWNIAAKVIPNTAESVDEVMSPRFFICLPLTVFGLMNDSKF